MFQSLTKNLLLVLFIFFQITSYCQIQEEGFLQIRTVPVLGTLLIKSGDSLLTKTNLSFPVGEHQLSLWAPGYEPLDTTISVYLDSITYVRNVLKPTIAHEAYKDDLLAYRKKHSTPRHIALGITLGSIGASTFLFFDAKRQLSVVENIQNNYSLNTGGSVQIVRDDFEQELSRYKSKKTIYQQVNIVSLISIGVTSYLYYRHLDNRRPVFDPPNVPPFMISYKAMPVISNSPFLSRDYLFLSTSIAF